MGTPTADAPRTRSLTHDEDAVLRAILALSSSPRRADTGAQGLVSRDGLALPEIRLVTSWSELHRAWRGASASVTDLHALQDVMRSLGDVMIEFGAAAAPEPLLRVSLLVTPESDPGTRGVECCLSGYTLLLESLTPR